MKILPFFAVFLVVPAHGQWQELIRAQNLSDFVVAEKSVAQTERIAKACDIEITNNEFPIECLQLIQNQLTNPNGLKESQNLFRKIAKLCSMKSHGLQSQDQVESLLQQGFLPEDCKKSIEERLLDLKYIDERGVGPNIE